MPSNIKNPNANSKTNIDNINNNTTSITPLINLTNNSNLLKNNSLTLFNNNQSTNFLNNNSIKSAPKSSRIRVNIRAADDHLINNHSKVSKIY
jgi:hypothetical protein